MAYLSIRRVVCSLVCWLAFVPAARAIEIETPSVDDETLTVTGITIPEPIVAPPGVAVSKSPGENSDAYELGRVIGYYITIGPGLRTLVLDIAASPEASETVINLATPVSIGDVCVLVDVFAGAYAMMGEVTGPKANATGKIAENLSIEGFTEGATEYTISGLPAGAQLRARYVAPGGREVSYQLTEGAYPDLDGEANGILVLPPLRPVGPPYVLAGDVLILAAVDTTEVYAGAWTAEGLGVRYVVPVASHIVGATGVPFISDLSIANPFGLEASGWVRFVQDGAAWQSSPAVSFTLAPGETVAWEDVLQSAFGISSNVKGTLLIGGTPLWQLAVSSRNYAVDGEGRRFGIAIPGFPSLDAVSDRGKWILPGLREGGGFRTNLIVAGATPQPSSITVRVVSGGEVLATADREVPGYGLLQINRVAEALGAGEVEGGYLEIVVNSGGVYPALSVVDGTADDAAFIQARPMLAGS